MDGPTGDDVAAAFDAISKGGTVVVTGMASHHTPPGIPVSLLMLAGMEKRIQGCLFGMCSPAVDILRQIDLYRAGRLKLDELVTRRYALGGHQRRRDRPARGPQPPRRHHARALRGLSPRTWYLPGKLALRGKCVAEAGQLVIGR